MTVSKPLGDQAVVLKVDGATRINLTAIASESITLVRVGDRLVVLFDNRATVALESFFQGDGQPQGDLRLQIAPDRVVDGAQFAALFPVTTDQSILPAAGESAPGSSPYFSRGLTIDQLGGGGGPLNLLAASGGAGVAGGATSNRAVNTSPTIGSPDAADLDDEGLIGGEGDVPGAPTAFTGSLDVDFGSQFVGRTLEFTPSQVGLAG